MIYLDNSLIYSQTENKYVQYISQKLRALQDSDLQVKLEKSIFYIKKNKVSRIYYLRRRS